ncbi:MAG: hypothetical protein M2R45_04885 [Verrucomicrobia subdivision 3 bacterium]|nr:hypothetical protein [Limisphaerales bacterium]MCS1414379.1 hypothetical protein [Limisphaerales bacterium]
MSTTRKKYRISALAGGVFAVLSLQVATASPDGKSIAINFGSNEPSGAEDPTSVVEGPAGFLETVVWNNTEGEAGDAEPVVADENGNSVETDATVTWASNNTWSSTGRGEENNTAPASGSRNLMAGYLDTNASDTIFVQVDNVPYDVYTVYVYTKGGVTGRSGDYKVNCHIQFHLDAAAFDGEFEVGENGDVLIYENIAGDSFRLEATPVNFRAPINGIEIVEAPGVTVPTDPPMAAGNLRAVEEGALRALIAWDMAAGATAYEVWQNGNLVAQTSDTSYQAMNLNPETEYKFQIISLDDFCNSSDPTGELTVTTAALGEAEGFVIARIYNTGGGASFSDLEDAYNHPDFPDNPSQSIPQSGAQLSPDIEGGGGDNYLGLIQFKLVVETAGQYDFFIRSDDASELYLNTNGPAFPVPGSDNDLVIAWEEDCCAPFQEPDVADTETTISPISLTPGTYGVTVTWKEGGGGDWVQVAWRNVNDDTPAADLGPIGGPAIVSEFDTVGSRVAITSQPVAGEISENEPFMLSVGFDFASPYVSGPAIQWFKDGDPVPGANSANLHYKPLLQKSHAGKYKATLSVPGMSVTTEEVTLTVLDDNKPPQITAGAMSGGDGKFEVGISFSEPVDGSTVGDAANYSISAGTIDSVDVVTRPLDNFSPDITAVAIIDYHSARLTVSGLQAGEEYTVTVKGVSDVMGNAIPDTGAQATFTADDSYAWAVIGSQQVYSKPGTWADDAVRVTEDGFDIVSSGVDYWGDYDEATFVYQEIEGAFDKVAQIEYQDPSSQWARTGLQMREGLDIGKGPVPAEFADCPSAIIVDPDDPDAEPEVCIPEDVRFARYQTVHANPAVQWRNEASNNSYENNYRNDDTLTLAGGDQTRGANDGGGPLDYPNVWVRIKREGNTIMTFTGSDGVNWEARTTREFVDLKPSLFVGPFYAPELNNSETATGLQHAVVAQFRNVGDFVAPDGGGGGDGGIQGVSISDGTITIEFSGTLMSSDTVEGTYTPVAGATEPSFSTVAEGATKFYLAR